MYSQQILCLVNLIIHFMQIISERACAEVEIVEYFVGRMNRCTDMQTDNTDNTDINYHAGM